jgi:hypothetical protein
MKRSFTKANAQLRIKTLSNNSKLKINFIRAHAAAEKSLTPRYIVAMNWSIPARVAME